MGEVNLFQSHTFSEKLPAPFDEFPFTGGTGQVRSIEYVSKYNTVNNKVSTLHPASLRAILEYVDLLLDSGSTQRALGWQNETVLLAENGNVNKKYAVCYDSCTGDIECSCYELKENTWQQIDCDYGKELAQRGGKELLFALLPIALKDDEFEHYFTTLIEYKKMGCKDKKSLEEAAFILCDNLYRRIECPQECKNRGIPLKKANKVPNLQSAKDYLVTKVIKGDFKIFPLSVNLQQYNKMASTNDFVGKYKDNDVTYREVDKLLVPVLEDSYILPYEIDSICRHIKNTASSKRPFSNFLFRGESGTGKSEGAKAVAAGLERPYIIMRCEPHMELSDLLGQNVPDHSGSFLNQEYPTFLDIQMDAPTAWKKLTGEYNASITEETVLKKLIETAEKNGKYLSGKQQVRYVESPLVQAVRYGYVCELQEVDIILNSAVLAGLNALLDQNGMIRLPNGEWIKRHPKTVIIATANTIYAGCNPISQAVLSRMDMVIDFEELTKEEYVNRAVKLTNFVNTELVNKMADVILKMKERCKESVIDDGSCGFREFVSWIQSYMVCHNVTEAAVNTILSSVSADPEKRAEIYTTCFVPFFGTGHF